MEARASGDMQGKGGRGNRTQQEVRRAVEEALDVREKYERERGVIRGTKDNDDSRAYILSLSTRKQKKWLKQHCLVEKRLWSRLQNM